jgi:Fur family peroxide stress response transcriptional regulator
MNNAAEIRDKLMEKGLKVTPQRMRVMEAVYKLGNHPTTENIINYIRKTDPNVSLGTVYKVLETLVENDLIKRVKTDKGMMRYDGDLNNHHHIYCEKCDYIEDYVDEELDKLLKDFFEKNKIDNFSIENITVNINGKFIGHKIKK